MHKYLKRGYGIFYIGHRGHVETEGTLGEAPGRMHLVCSEDEVAALPEPAEEKLIYLTQTTLSIDETRGIVDALKKRFPRLEMPPTDDICYATQNRQDAVKELAKQADVVLVVGSQTSSNSRSLRQVAAAHGARAYLIDGPENITDEMVNGAGRGRHGGRVRPWKRLCSLSSPTCAVAALTRSRSSCSKKRTWNSSCRRASSNSGTGRSSSRNCPLFFRHVFPVD